MMGKSKIIISFLALCFLSLLISLVTIKTFYWRIVATQKHLDAPVELALEARRLQELQKMFLLHDKTLPVNSGAESRLTEIAFSYCYWDEHSFSNWFVHDFLRVDGKMDDKILLSLLKTASEYRKSFPITDAFFIPSSWNPNRGITEEEYLQSLGDYPELLKSCWAKIEKDAAR